MLLIQLGFLAGLVLWGRARVAKLVDALDLGSSGVTLESSSLSSRTKSGSACAKKASSRQGRTKVKHPDTPFAGTPSDKKIAMK